MSYLLEGRGVGAGGRKALSLWKPWGRSGCCDGPQDPRQRCPFSRVAALVFMQFLGSAGAVKCHRSSVATFVDMGGSEAIKSWPLAPRQLAPRYSWCTLVLWQR